MIRAALDTTISVSALQIVLPDRRSGQPSVCLRQRIQRVAHHDPKWGKVSAPIRTRFECFPALAHQRGDRVEPFARAEQLVCGSLSLGHVRLLAAPTGQPGRAAGAADDTTLGRQPSLPSTASSKATTSK